MCSYLDCVLGEHLHDTPVKRQVTTIFIFIEVLSQPHLLSSLVDLVELVRLCLVGTEDTEVLRVLCHNVTEEARKICHATQPRHASFLDLDTVGAEIWYVKLLLEQAAVCDRIGTHASVALGSKLPQFRDKLAVLVEVLFRLVAAQPSFELFETLGVGEDVGNWDLVSSPEALRVVVADLAGTGPALRCSENNHGPARPESLARLASLLLVFPDLCDTALQCTCHGLVHRG